MHRVSQHLSSYHARKWLLWSCAVLFVVLWCQYNLAESIPQENNNPKRLSAAHLPNAIQVTKSIISGGQPQGEKGFAELQRLGVKTVISVDGARPEVKLAKKYGLRYVHLPHGYNGISTKRIAELAKATQSLDGPIYIHCHHGKHRSPAATAVACVATEQLTTKQATQLLKLAGTSPHYVGLYQSVASTQPIDSSTLAKLEVTFREVVPTPPLVEMMVAAEHSFDRLLKFQSNNWQPLPEQPDLSPAHEALLLREQFTEMLRVKEQPSSKGYLRLLKDSEQRAKDLEVLLHSGEFQSNPEVLQEKAAQQIISLKQNCTKCHQQYRDQPLQSGF